MRWSTEIFAVSEDELQSCAESDARWWDQHRRDPFAYAHTSSRAFYFSTTGAEVRLAKLAEAIQGALLASGLSGVSQRRRPGECDYSSRWFAAS